MEIGKNSYDFSKGRRKLKIQIRMSPIGKIKAPPKAPQKSLKKAPKKSGTGVAAAHPDYPASTNVSSPIQVASRRRVRHTTKVMPEPDLHRNGYAQDGFVVGDDDESDAFSEMEPIRVKGKSRSVSKRPLGPPITTDGNHGGLTELHQAVVEDFLNNARARSREVSFNTPFERCDSTNIFQILLSKQLREHPFTDTMLREMAINWISSKSLNILGYLLLY